MLFPVVCTQTKNMWFTSERLEPQTYPPIITHSWKITHFATFDSRRGPNSDSSSWFSPLKKRKQHLQLTKSVEFSFNHYTQQFSIDFSSSGGGTPSFSALWSSWNLGHPRPLGGGLVLDSRPCGFVNIHHILRCNLNTHMYYVNIMYIYINM